LKWTTAWAKSGKDRARTTSETQRIFDCFNTRGRVVPAVFGKGKRHMSCEFVDEVREPLGRNVRRRITTSWRSNRCKAETRLAPSLGWMLRKRTMV
jgi:hypothetical protein